MKKNKYLYVWVVQGYYTGNYKWEDISQSESYREARQDLKDYNANEQAYPHRLIWRKELNSEFK